ncbi:hypothetical protein D3875_03505 [Deinococcus cavernae]|uniref:Uncharacterized protein n=1 Tax=Deinococcus cavernae TaxID=2320857 RepID=A0A418VEX2_9DEIO|nr:hypothetical protein [Deinococcus cavernae]RJF74620.1 hypothetical protein D3875_03505 [Deinococcus cavernae]
MTNKFAALAAQGLNDSRQEKEETPQQRRGEELAAPGGPSRMLGGRVPDSLFKEFQYAKMAAETATGIRRVTTEDAVAAFVRMLRDPQVVENWHQELLEVRKNR